MLTKNIYFSIDIETNGLAAGINSMISLGVCAINVDTGFIAGSQKWNLRPFDNLKVDPKTMEWWQGFPEAYKRATEHAQEPVFAVCEFVKWVKYICSMYSIEQPVAAAWKPGFDLAFVRYYLHRIIGSDLFGRSGSGLDIKTLTAIALNQPFSETQIATVPVELKNGYVNHTHDAMDDAIEQAYVLYNARRMLNTRV